MSIERVLSHFTNLDIETPNEPYHVLSYQYPAEELAPEGFDLHLVPPMHMVQRNRPPSDPRLLGMTDLSIYTMISTSSNPQTVQGQREHEKLLNAVEELSRVPGNSVLKLVRYVDDDRERPETMCRARLETTESNGAQTVKDFTLTTADMNGLRGHLQDYPWLRLLDHLIFCESDRAWYHVASNLKSIPMEQYEQEWQEDGAAWATDLDGDLGWVFRNNVKVLSSEQTTDSTEVVEVETQCGHRMTVYKDDVANMTLDRCISAACTQCGRPILNDYALAGLKARQDTEKAKHFLEENKLWIRLDHEIDAGEFKFPADEVFVALEMSLRSFTPPKLACPPGFSFGDYRATKAVLQNFRDNFEDLGEEFEVSARDLARHLLQTAMETTIGSSTVPISRLARRPRFMEDLLFWIRRAVNLAVASCKQSAKDAAAREESLLAAMGELNLDRESVESIGSMFAKMGI